MILKRLAGVSTLIVLYALFSSGCLSNSRSEREENERFESNLPEGSLAKRWQNPEVISQKERLQADQEELSRTVAGLGLIKVTRPGCTNSTTDLGGLTIVDKSCDAYIFRFKLACDTAPPIPIQVPLKNRRITWNLGLVAKGEEQSDIDGTATVHFPYHIKGPPTSVTIAFGGFSKTVAVDSAQEFIVPNEYCN